MAENSILSALRQTFPSANKETWHKIASREIDNKDPFEDLSWSSSENIKFFPYYDADDTLNFQHIGKFARAADEDSFLGPRKWINCPQVNLTKSILANKVALAHLQHGADGIFFSGESDLKLEALLDKIEWPYCALYFHCNKPEQLAEHLRDYIKTRRWNEENLEGALFWDRGPKKNVIDSLFESPRSFRWNGFYIDAGKPTDEIASALQKGAMLIHEFENEAGKAERVARSIAFSLQASTDFLETVSKLKALRMLWFQVVQAFGIKTFLPDDLIIHITSDAWSSPSFEPHANMIKSTIAAMAAVLGGCNALSVMPEEETSMQQRIARNLSLLLREESHFDKVSDPLAGAFAIDSLVNELAKTAWAKFQKKISA